MKYKDDYVALHQTQKFFKGQSILSFKEHVSKLVTATNSKTILDYGSGKGKQYSHNKLDLYWGVEVDCYDPGYEPFSQLPNKVYDGVVCTEVMEHIPEEEVDEAFTNIFSKANKFVFLSICLAEATNARGKTLLDGSNLHVTLKSMDWWKDKIILHNKNNVRTVIIFTGIHKKKGAVFAAPSS